MCIHKDETFYNTLGPNYVIKTFKQLVIPPLFINEKYIQKGLWALLQIIKKSIRMVKGENLIISKIIDILFYFVYLSPNTGQVPENTNCKKIISDIFMILNAFTSTIGSQTHNGIEAAMQTHIGKIIYEMHKFPLLIQNEILNNLNQWVHYQDNIHVISKQYIEKIFTESMSSDQLANAYMMYKKLNSNPVNQNKEKSQTDFAYGKEIEFKFMSYAVTHLTNAAYLFEVSKDILDIAVYFMQKTHSLLLEEWLHGQSVNNHPLLDIFDKFILREKEPASITRDLKDKDVSTQKQMEIDLYTLLIFYTRLCIKYKLSTSKHFVSTLHNFMTQYKITHWNDIQQSGQNDPTKLNDGSFVGLTNLGCTCYINCNLQQLFMSSTFKNYLYLLSFVTLKHEKHKTLEELQILFKKMDGKNTKSITPSSLISTLLNDEGKPINVKVQEDASGSLFVFFLYIIELNVRPNVCVCVCASVPI